MTNEELVKALRYCMTKEDGITICEPCPYYGKGIECENVLHTDAAAAIEGLQAEVERLEPKRGKWTEIEDYDGDFHYQCSVCGEEWYFIDGTPADNNANYCPRCGAKMEVQE